MKKIFKYFTVAAASVLAFASCETYKVAEPATTAVAWLDGQYVCFAYEETDLVNPVSVFDIAVTNTTRDEANRAWFTISNLNADDCYDAVYNACFEVRGDAAYATALANQRYFYFLDAYRFDVNCDGKTQTFSCINSTSEMPYTCYNAILERSYYSACGYFDATPVKTVINVTGGKVVTNGADTATGYKTDTIEFKISIYNIANDTTKTLIVKGIKNTGWGEDMLEYGDWLDANF